jgi:hypothetical protein
LRLPQQSEQRPHRAHVAFTHTVAVAVVLADSIVDEALEALIPGEEHLGQQ